MFNEAPKVITATALALALAWSPWALAAEESIGNVDFGVSCAEPVRADFDRALSLMHHMMYQEARGAFEKVIAADPDCAMAYWGFATTLFQPLWGTRPSEEDLQRGWNAIQQARDLVDSEREALLTDASAAFFREPETADFSTRIERWIAAMEAPYEAHPDDPDIAALYALSRLTLAQRVEERGPLFDEAEAILREVYQERPEHPGAIHYSIHATDADGRAENALERVEAYSEIAPDVPHALHMPSHIYVRLGDWPAVIEWNQRSAEAALEHPVNGAVSHHYIHAVDYLAYAHLQSAADEQAEAAAEKALGTEPYQGSFISAFHAASIPARLAVEQRDWKQAAALEPRTPAYLPWEQSPWAEGQTWYARGLGAVHTGDMETAREAERRLQALHEGALAEGESDMATYIDIDRRVLAGRIAFARGDEEEAVALTESAAELEATVEKHPVTPGALLPPYEALGELLLDLDRPAEAREAYQASNATWPGRYHTLLGTARAANAAGEEQAAREHYAELMEITAAGTTREGVREARQFVGD